MHILHVIGSINRLRGGPVPAAAGLITLCGRLGHRSSVLTVALPGEEHEFPAETIIHRMPASFPARAMTSRAAAAWLARHHAEHDLIVIHECYSFLCLQAGRVLNGTDTPFVIVPHASLHPTNLVRKSALKRLLGHGWIAPMLRRTRAVWATSEMERRELTLFSTRPVTITLPLAVTPPLWPGDRAKFRQEIGADETDFVVGFIGRFNRVKQVELLVRAVAACRARHPRLRLVLAGAGDAPDERRLQELVAVAGLAGRTAFPGFVDAATRNDLLAGCDLFAMPSQWENFSLATVEALQAGVSVLLSRNIGVGADVAAAEAGWLCAPTLDGLTTALDGILSAPAEVQRRAQNARPLGAQFQPARLMHRYAEAIQAAVGHA